MWFISCFSDSHFFRIGEFGSPTQFEQTPKIFCASIPCAHSQHCTMLEWNKTDWKSAGTTVLVANVETFLRVFKEKSVPSLSENSSVFYVLVFGIHGQGTRVAM